MLHGIKTRDVNGVPKIFPRRFDKLLTLSQDGYLLDLEFNCVCAREGYPVVEVPVEHSARFGGKSMTTISQAVALYKQAFQYRMEPRSSDDIIISGRSTSSARLS